MTALAPPSRIIPTPASPTVATYTILVDGSPLPPEVEVLSLVVNRQVNRVPSATLIIRDGKVADQTFAVSEAAYFDPGNTVTIQLGYRATNVEVFTGEVTGQQIRVRDQKSFLIVTLKGPSYKMTLKRKSRHFSDQSDSDVWETLLNEYRLAGDITPSSNQLPDLTQYRSTDWDFLLSRVEAYGRVCIPRDGKVDILVPKVAATAVLKLEFGANLLHFDGDLDARTQFENVAATAYDSSAAETVTEENGPGTDVGGSYSTGILTEAHGQEPLPLYHGGALMAPELSDWAQGRSRQSSLSRVRGTASFTGTEVVTVGSTVELAGFGPVFNGMVYVAGVRHELAEGTWTTTAQLGLPTELFHERYPISAPAAGGLLPSVSGLQIGKVLAVHEDPAGEERIQVELPANGTAGTGSWARLATLMGGSSSGTWFRPGVGEEVIVGFLDDDPRHPIILGAVHSGNAASPDDFKPTEQNDRAGYVSRGGNVLSIYDEEEQILLATQSGDSLELKGKDGVISIADQHGNSIELSSGGITIESASSLTLKGSQSVTIEGSTVDIKANGTASLQASGTLELKGSLTQIN